MAYEDLDEILDTIRGYTTRVRIDQADEEAGLGPRKHGTKAPWARGFSGSGIADAIGTALQRGGETFVEELTSPIRDIPGGIQRASEVLGQPPEDTVLGRLRQGGEFGLNIASAALSPARAVFSPVSGTMRALTELPLLLAERPDQPRPELAETYRKGAQIAGEVATGAIGARVLGRLRQAKAARADATAGLAERDPAIEIDNTTGRVLSGRFGQQKELPERGIGDEPERVFNVGPPGSVTGKPVQAYDPALKDPITGRVVQGARPKEPDPLRATQDLPPPRPLMSELEIAAQDIKPRPGESVGEAMRRRARRMRGETDPADLIVDDVVEDVLKGPSVKEYFPTGMPSGMSMRDRVKLHQKNETRKVQQAMDELDDVELDATPSHIRDTVRAQSPPNDADHPTWLGEWNRWLKTKLPLSMTQVAKGDPEFEPIVKLLNNAHMDRHSYQEEFIQKFNNFVKELGGDKEFEKFARAYDVGKSNLGQPATKWKAITDEWADFLHLSRDHPLYRPGYVPHLRNTVKVERTKLIPVDDWVATDIRSAFPSHFKPYFTKARKVDVPGDDYSADAMRAHIAGVARAGVYGTPQKHGVLGDLQPMLSKLQNRRDSYQDYVANYINHAIGHPAFRSEEGAQKLGNFVRSVEFMRTIGANLTSPVYNSLQRALTVSEVSVSAAAQALKDEARFLAGDDTIKALLRKAHVPLESLGPRKMETETFMEGLPKKLVGTRDVLAMPFGFAERGNRVHAFFSGYRNALGKGASEAEAIQAGRDLINKTQFMPGPADRPVWMRSELGQTFGQFKYFQTKMGEYMWNQFGDLFKRGSSTGEKASAANKLVKFWGSAYVLGGPQVMPVIGEWLEQHDPIAWKGALPSLGVAVTDQLGLGAIAPQDVASMKYYLPGPLINHGIDFLTALGWNPLNPEVPPNTAARARGATRSFPVAGVQLERLRRAAMVDEVGNERKPETTQEAFGIEPIPSSRPLIAKDVNWVKRGVGFQDPEQETEYRMMDKLNEAVIIKNQAINAAQQAYAVGDHAGSRQILRDAETRLGLPQGRLKLSPQSKRAQEDAAKMTPLERRRKAAGRALRDYGMEDTLP